MNSASFCSAHAAVNGIYTAKALRKIFDDQDLSKEALSLVHSFICKDMEMFAGNIAKMMYYPTEMSPIFL